MRYLGGQRGFDAKKMSPVADQRSVNHASRRFEPLARENSQARPEIGTHLTFGRRLRCLLDFP
jgi:hypothetical protein